MPQLARITFQSASFRYFKCPYQAKVMKMLEIVNNTMVRILIGRSSWIGDGKAFTGVAISSNV